MEDELKFQEEKLDDVDVYVLAITGELDANSIEQLNDHLMHIIGIGEHKIILDLVNVTFIDTTALDIIINKRNIICEKQGDIVIINIQSDILELINLLDFSNDLIIKANKEEGLKYLKEL